MGHNCGPHSNRQPNCGPQQNCGPHYDLNLPSSASFLVAQLLLIRVTRDPQGCGFLKMSEKIFQCHLGMSFLALLLSKISIVYCLKVHGPWTMLCLLWIVGPHIFGLHRWCFLKLRSGCDYQTSLQFSGPDKVTYYSMFACLETVKAILQAGKFTTLNKQFKLVQKGASIKHTSKTKGGTWTGSLQKIVLISKNNIS